MKQKRNNLLIAALLVLSVVLIAVTLFFSRERDQVPSFEVGKPWLHPRLEANFEFEIELDEETRLHIIDSVNKNFAKIYKLDQQKSDVKLTLLSRALAGKPGGQALLSAVSQLYTDGIVVNIPAYLAGLPEEAWMSEFVPIATESTADTEEVPGGDEFEMDELGDF